MFRERSALIHQMHEFNADLADFNTANEVAWLSILCSDTEDAFKNIGVEQH